jgi:uncharacterized surface protein with fasciclin (FAS1) repeats
MKNWLQTAFWVLFLLGLSLNAQAQQERDRKPPVPANTEKPTPPPTPDPTVRPEDDLDRTSRKMSPTVKDTMPPGQPATRDALRTTPAPKSAETTPNPATAADDNGRNVRVGGQLMLPNRTIVENANQSAAHSTLVSALRAAQMTEILQGAGPFTVFAPVNDAFENLAPGATENLMRAENRTRLSGLLNYHVVAGRYDFNALSAMARSGKNTLQTVNGALLTIMMNGPHNIVIQDESGNVANIVTYDVYQSNGVVHVVDTVLQPK